MASNTLIKLLCLCKLIKLRYDGKGTCARLVLGIPPLTYFQNLDYKYLVSTSYKCACFGSTYTKIGTIQRRLAWLPCARMTRNIVKRSKFFIFSCKILNNFNGSVALQLSEEGFIRLIANCLNELCII